MCILEENHFSAPVIWTWNHQAFAAGLAFLHHKGLFSAKGASDHQRSAAAGANRILFRYFPHAGRASQRKRAAASAAGAEAGVRFDQGIAKDAVLFV